ncbi:hypothetical protein EDC04DRAFT_2596733, partial [Pisolithus marmoratus]
NDWNRYSKYFTHYMAWELERLQMSGVSTGSINITMRKKCYELFKKEYHDTWQEILVKFEESTQYTETGKTVSQWQQLFNKSAKRFTQLASFHMTVL